MKLFIAFILTACLMIGVYARQSAKAHAERAFDVHTRFAQAVKRVASGTKDGTLNPDDAREAREIITTAQSMTRIIYLPGAAPTIGALEEKVDRLDAITLKPVPLVDEGNFAMRR
jgi:hypothetical protein